MSAGSSDAGQVEIREIPHSMLDDVFVTTSQRTVLFDVSRGLVHRVDFESSQAYASAAIGGKITTITTLAGVEQRDPNWATAVAVEMSDYFAVKQEYDELVERAGKESAQTRTLLARAKANVDDCARQCRQKSFRTNSISCCLSMRGRPSTLSRG